MKDGCWLHMRCSKGRYSMVAGQCQPDEGACLRTVTLHALLLLYCTITVLSICAKHFSDPPSFLPFTQVTLGTASNVYFSALQNVSKPAHLWSHYEEGRAASAPSVTSLIWSCKYQNARRQGQKTTV
jgi:hypothetical protein